MNKFQEEENNIDVSRSVKPVAITINKEKKSPECVICFATSTKKLLSLPCCEKPICKTCTTRLEWNKEDYKTKKCPHCRQEIKVEKKKETVTRFTCCEFWTMFYFISYLILSVVAIGFSVYDIYSRSDDSGAIVDNVLLGIISNICIIWWFAEEYFHTKGDITKMPSAWWGISLAMGTFVIRFSLYFAPLPNEFMRTYFCSLLMDCASVITYFTFWCIFAVLKNFWNAIRPIFCSCGHKEERETSTVELSMP